MLFIALNIYICMQIFTLLHYDDKLWMTHMKINSKCTMETASVNNYLSLYGLP